jgi:hypothetical protein
VQFFDSENWRFFKNNPDKHEFPDIMVDDRGWVKIFKFVVDVNTVPNFYWLRTYY